MAHVHVNSRNVTIGGTTGFVGGGYLSVGGSGGGVPVGGWVGKLSGYNGPVFASP